MKNIYAIVAMCIFLSYALNAQQIPLFSQSSQYQSILNPAALNLENKIYTMEMPNTVRLSFRKQWTQIEDAPQTGMIQYIREFKDLNMLGGITLVSDKTGPTSLTGGFLRYAYQVKPDNYSTISIGLEGGFYQYRYEGHHSLLRDANDIVGLETQNKYVADFKLGVFYNGILSDVDMIYAGLSIPQLANVNVRSKEGSKDFFIYRSRHFYGNIGYIKFLGGVFDNLPYHSFLEPSFEIKYAVNAPVQMTGNVRLMLSGLFWAGTGFSFSSGNGLYSSDNLHMEVGFLVGENFNQENQVFKISYGYDRTLSDFSVQLGNTHEINLSYSF